jgi:ribonuclease HII
MKSNKSKENVVKKSPLSGYEIVGGVGIAGKDAWAGPLVAAICIFPAAYTNDALSPSKKISEKQKTLLFDMIKKDAIEYRIFFLSPTDYDNIAEHSKIIKLAIEKSYDLLTNKPDCLVINGYKVQLACKTITLNSAADRCIITYAAEILAEVSRNAYMANISKKLTNHNFHKNKGYYTYSHLDYIHKNYVVDNFHRISQIPVRNAIIAFKEKHGK